MRSPVSTPGAAETAKTRVLETGSDLLQAKPPVSALNTYLDGFHFYSGDMKAQMEAHHYCSILNEDVTQCVIFDGNTNTAKLMGVEYIISRKLFLGLPVDEKRLWHSHNFEVSSGELIAPGVPPTAEHALMEKIASTYGKTWHTWNTDLGKSLPTGIPKLMMGFTEDGQIDPEMVSTRDKNFKVSTSEKRKQRADIQPPPVAKGANSWQSGQALQLGLQTVRH